METTAEKPQVTVLNMWLKSATMRLVYPLKLFPRTWLKAFAPWLALDSDSASATTALNCILNPIVKSTWSVSVSSAVKKMRTCRNLVICFAVRKCRSFGEHQTLRIVRDEQYLAFLPPRRMLKKQKHRQTTVFVATFMVCRDDGCWQHAATAFSNLLYKTDSPLVPRCAIKHLLH